MNLDKCINYDDFFEEVWEEVSLKVVDDDMWDKYIDEFQEITFGLYSIYKNSSITLPNSERVYIITPRIIARIIENFVINLKPIFC